MHNTFRAVSWQFSFHFSFISLCVYGNFARSKFIDSFLVAVTRGKASECDHQQDIRCRLAEGRAEGVILKEAKMFSISEFTKKIRVTFK